MNAAAPDPSWTWKSWIGSANDPESGFPLQNLPLCAFESQDGSSHLGVGIGDLVLDLHACSRSGQFDSLPENVRTACLGDVLNSLMEQGPGAAESLRRLVMRLLKDDSEPEIVSRLSACLLPMQSTSFRIPVRIGDYTDFYASIHHATNVGRLFRPDQPLLPNYKFVPIGYHGRASSIVISGTPVTRPRGQINKPSATAPVFEATQQLDYELEVGAYIGVGNHLGEPIDIANARQHIFGVTLVNDWSARDIQAWEYQPLGPFLGKSFATSVSPWVVTSAALVPFRTPLSPRASDDPEPLPYLRSPSRDYDGIDVQLEVRLSTAAMRRHSIAPVKLSASNLRDLYWSFTQMVAHHTSNGCNLRAGDLLASGTVSGPADGMSGCLLEMTRRGTVPIALPTGETRRFLEDGDEVTLMGTCRREGYPVIKLGECRGVVNPAHT